MRTFNVDTSVTVFECAVTDGEDIVDGDAEADFVEDAV